MASLPLILVIIITVSSINITRASPKSCQFSFSLWLLRQCSFPLPWSKIFVLIILHLAVQLLVDHQWPVFLSCPMTSQNGCAASLIHRGYQWFPLSWAILQYHLYRQSWWLIVPGKFNSLEEFSHDDIYCCGNRMHFWHCMTYYYINVWSQQPIWMETNAKRIVLSSFLYLKLEEPQKHLTDRGKKINLTIAFEPVVVSFF